MINLKTICEKVLELDKAATDGPWDWDNPKTDSDLETRDRIGPKDSEWMFASAVIVTDNRCYPPNDNDADLIINYRTSAPLLAKKLLLAIETLEKCSCLEWKGQQDTYPSRDVLSEMEKE